MSFQTRFTLKRGMASSPSQVAVGAGAAEAQSDTISLNIDATLISRGEVLTMLEDLKAYVHRGNWPPAEALVVEPGDAARIIDGVAIGDEGSGIYEGYVLAAGENYETDIEHWHPLHNPYSGYSHSAPHTGNRTTNPTSLTGDASFFVDPYFRGAYSQSQTVLAYNSHVTVDTEDAELTMRIASPEAGLLPYLPTTYDGNRGDGADRPLLIGANLCSWPHAMVSAKGNYILEFMFMVDNHEMSEVRCGIWSTTLDWPNKGEVDTGEFTKNVGETGVIEFSNGVHVNASDGGADVVFTDYENVPCGQYIRKLSVKTSGKIEFYHDAAAPGTLVETAETTTNISRFGGAHDIRLQMSSDVNPTINGTTFPAEYHVRFWRLWVPVDTPLNEDTIELAEVNTTPGGSWAATFPNAATLWAGGDMPDLEECVGLFYGLDTPGAETRANKRPGGMTVDMTARTMSGTVPSTRGGRVGLLFTGSFNGGGMARRAIKYINVAPAVQASLFANETFDLNDEIDIDVEYTDFHSGELGPHTYNVSSDKAWPTITGNGTGSVNLGGDAPATEETATITIICTNAIGQTTTVQRTLEASDAAWDPATSWTNLVAWYSPRDAATVWEDTAGTDAADVNSDTVKRLSDKKGSAHLTEATNPPAYVSSGGFNWLSFTRATPTHLETTDATLVALGNGSNPYTIVMIAKRGTAAQSITYAAWTSVGGGVAHQSRHYASGANAFGMQRTFSGSVQAVETGTHADTDEFEIITFCYTGSAGIILVDGVEITTPGGVSMVKALTVGKFLLGSLFTTPGGTYDSSTAFGSLMGDVFLSSDASITADVVAANAYLATTFAAVL